MPPTAKLDDLVADVEDARAALAAYEATATDALIIAKAAHRADPNDDTAAAKAEAVTAVQLIRSKVRAGRVGHAVAGDAFVSTETEG